MKTSEKRRVILTVFLKRCFLILENLDAILLHWTRTRLQNQPCHEVFMWLCNDLSKSKINLKFENNSIFLWNADALQFPVNILDEITRNMFKEICNNWSKCFKSRIVNKNTVTLKDSALVGCDDEIVDWRLLVGRWMSLLLSELKGSIHEKVDNIFHHSRFKILETIAINVSKDNQEKSTIEMYVYIDDLVRNGSIIILNGEWNSSKSYAVLLPKNDTSLLQDNT